MMLVIQKQRLTMAIASTVLTTDSCFLRLIFPPGVMWPLPIPIPYPNLDHFISRS